MLPFYFLSVVTNLVMGFILVVIDKQKENSYKSFFNDSTFLLILTILASISGVFKLLDPIAGGLPILGDFFPALTGIAGALVFLNRYFKSLPQQQSIPSAIEFLDTPAVSSIIGIACLTVGILHMLFAQAPLL
ncbi:hypothetical protein HMPREF9554_00382 [Treponema phagedenis F0421]|uniref:hypothetical protein n=1 Tax=Treponema phagedenis TaxID=162 RepID=UPI0001F64289|nr:hypothetical protein [Treponema phagedenis]EFW39140.1 hypothetical protein HMPREF9554_00382 [Treponema phagedenis F0421]